MKQTNKRAIKQPIRIIVLFFGIVLLCVVLFSLQPKAAEQANSGTCGEQAEWRMDGNELVIYGSGPIYDYSPTEPAPWKGLNIYKVRIEPGITQVGRFNFADIGSASPILIPASVQKIRTDAFPGAKGGIHFLGTDIELEEACFYNFTGTCYYYYADWDTGLLQTYGGSVTWERGRLSLVSDSCRTFAPNTVFDTKSFRFHAKVGSYYDYFVYTPNVVTVSAHDNSTMGLKTVTINADGYEFEHQYFITDGQHHLDMVQVELPGSVFPYVRNGARPTPVVTAGDYVLEQYQEYTLSYENNTVVGTEATVTVTGRGVFEGLVKTVQFAIVKRDLATYQYTLDDMDFMGEYCEHDWVTSHWVNASVLETDFVRYYENNVNAGVAKGYAVGLDNCYGITSADFNITFPQTKLDLPGAHNGYYGSELNDEVAVIEGWMSPGPFVGRVDTGREHIVVYELYRMDGEEAVLVKTVEKGPDVSADTKFHYDFTTVYDTANDDWMETYVLTYTWLDSWESIYSGACILYIPTKVPTATQMAIDLVEEDDFRADYVDAYGIDGDLGIPQWTVSDPSMATVEANGQVTFKKPGVVTVTGTYAGLSASRDLMATVQDITKAIIFDCDADAGTANVIYDNQLLIPGTDYTLTTTVNDGITEVMVTGCGLFEGYLMRQFNAQGEPVGHTHSFDAACDETCGSCDFTRVTQHTFRERWMKDETAHWHGCSVCGKQKDYETHTLSDAETCTVCGPLREPGDVNADGKTDTDDAVYLLLHVMFGSTDYPVEGGVVTDFNDDGKLDTDDAVYLLLHVMFGEQDYPLPA